MSTPPKYFLYLWNPAVWHWADMGEAIVQVERGEWHITDWTCGPRKDIEVGDRFLFMKLGSMPVYKKGIAGAGVIVSPPKMRLLWEDEKLEQGRQTKSTEIKFLALDFEPFINLEILRDQYPQKYWTPRNSGTIIPANIGQEIYDMIVKGK